MNPKPVEQEVPERVNLLLVAQVRAMLQNEAYHYCADCHTHCRQTILAAEATKEAAQAYDKLIARHAKLVEAARKFVNAYDGEKAVRLGNGQARRSLDEFRKLLNPKDGRETE